MSADTGRVSISRFSSDMEQKQVLQETVYFVLEIKRLAAANDHLLAHLKKIVISPPHLAAY